MTGPVRRIITIVVLRKAAALAPGQFQIQLDIGFCHRQLGHDAEAESAYLEAARLEPRDADSRANLASLLAEQGRVDEIGRAHV